MDQLVLRFSFLPRTKRQMEASFDEWGGVVKEWHPETRPFLVFGTRSGTRKQGRVVTMPAAAGQLLYYCGCNTAGRPLKLFGLAWRSTSGDLVAKPLPRETVARAVFEAGGHQEPADDTASTIEQITRVDSADPQAFQELWSITVSYMEAHLLAGAPVPEPTASLDKLATEMTAVLDAHGRAWPQYRDVLCAAAENLREWLALPP